MHISQWRFLQNYLENAFSDLRHDRQGQGSSKR